jgi:hypothetical protein
MEMDGGGISNNKQQQQEEKERMFIRTLSYNQRVFHREHGPGNIVGKSSNRFARVMFDRDRHKGADGVREVPEHTLTLHHGEQ